MFANLKKGLLLGALLASGAGGALIWYVMRHKSGENEKVKEESPNAAYNDIKQFVERSFETTRVILVESAAEWEEALEILLDDLRHVKVLGMDCEWVNRGGKRQPVSMLQLSTLNCTALVRIHLLNNQRNIPRSLIDMLENKSILKVGVGVLDDGAKLLSDYGIEMTGCVDLRYLAGRHNKSWSAGSLKKYAEDVAGMTLEKTNDLRCGDWEAQQLPSSMQVYAARDSQAGLAVFLCLVALKLSSNSEYPTALELIELLQKRSLPMCHGIVDTPFKGKNIASTASATDRKTRNATPTRLKAISSHAVRSKAMYSNCVMKAPDGQILCVCDVKKAQWYCDKGLADKVFADDAEELVIRLRFQPRGRPSGERDFYRSRKENICVVCGADKSFLRKNIVPREYRKYFPEILKSHSSHDVVLLCTSCHSKSSVFDQQYKGYFADLCGAPYKAGGVQVDSDLKKVRLAARTLNGYSDRIPVEKMDECRTVLRQYYGIEEITADVLQRACDINDRGNKPQDHGMLVVQHFLDNSTIQEFQRLWRQRFVERMKPEHLGDYWHIDYNHLDYLWVKSEEHGEEQEGEDI